MVDRAGTATPKLETPWLKLSNLHGTEEAQAHLPMCSLSSGYPNRVRDQLHLATKRCGKPMVKLRENGLQMADETVHLPWVTPMIQ